MHDYEHCYFSLKSNPEKIMGCKVQAHANGSEVICTGNIGWFTAKRNENPPWYVLVFGTYPNPKEKRDGPLLSIDSAQVLDEDEGSSKIQSWQRGHYAPNDNQKWVFEAAPAHPYYRIKNFSTGRYLTYNPPDNRVWGYRFCESDDQIWEKH